MRLWWTFCLLGSVALAARAQTPVPTAATPPAALPALEAPVPPPATAPGTDPLAAVLSPAERATYDAAIREFDAGLFDRAARSLGEFVDTYPDSSLRPDARLRQAFAAAAAGTNAATTPALLAFAHDHPDSPLAVNALLRAGRSLLGQGRPQEVLKALDPAVEPLAGALARAERPLELMVALQLRAEAALQTRQPALAVAALDRSGAWISAAPPSLAFDRLRLLLQAHLQAGAAPRALAAGEQLQSLAEAPALAGRRPEALSLLGSALLRVGDTNRALGVYARNLTNNAPVPLVREATLQMSELERRAGQLAPARSRLESYLAAQPEDPQLGHVRGALAQVLYAQHQTTRGTTNEGPALLALAESHLSAALTNAAPEIRGDLQLLLGWCLWESNAGTNQLPKAAAAFEEAARLLPRSPAQAVARFKLADAQFRQGQAPQALSNYLAVAEGYATLPEVDTPYGTLAWQQAVAAAIATTNFPVAQRAMEKLVSRDPRAEATAEGLLQLTTEYGRQGNPLRGRTLLEQFVARFPDSPLRSELELSVADALRREEQWPAALGAYDRWLAANPGRTNRPWAEFGRALVLLASGGTTNAMEQFVQLANRYPNDRLAPLALLSLGDHYFQQGEFGQAEQAYTSVLTNAAWKGSARHHEAQLRAGQAAMGWKQYARAQERLRELLNDPTTPADYLPEGYFTLGQARLLSPSTDTNAPLASVTDALDAFKAVTTFTNSPYVPEAWLAMAECHRQLAATRPASFAAARELFGRALDPKSPVEPAVRARAKIGLGRLALQQAVGRPEAEAQALEAEARDHFLDVALGKITAITGPLEASVLKEAGLEAALLLEARGLGREADALYERLGSELPGMRPFWEARRERIQRN